MGAEPTARPRVRACLFDLDGTLIAPSIDFGELNRRVRAVVANYGLDAAAFAGAPALEILAAAQAELARRDPAVACRFAAEAQEAILAVELEAAERVQTYSGVSELLHGLGAMGIAIAIVTRNGRGPVERILQRLPLAHDLLLTRDDVAHVKPDPRHLLVALSRLGVSPAEAMMVGDHPMDIVAGRRAGLYTVAVFSGDMTAEAFAAEPPDLLLAHVTELGPALLRAREAPAVRGAIEATTRS
jgi:phosphoglycolate phosphatase